MSEHAYDLVVLGAGSGGLATSKRAASYGARVAIIEHDRVGGTCVIRGCVPKKLMVYAAEFAHAFEDARGYGWSATTPTLDWPALVAARDSNVASLEATHERLLREAGVELISGRARITGPQEVEVDGRRISAGRILVATGSRPRLPAIEGIGHVMTSDDFFKMAEQPREVAVIGAGYIACELAGVLQAVGTRVHLVFRGDLPLRGFDCDLRRELDGALRASGMQVHAHTVVDRICKEDSGGFTLALEGPDGCCSLAVDQCLLYATGRVANTAGLGLEELGLELDELDNLICAEDASTSIPSIFAIGDVTGRSPLTPVAIHAGRLWADRIFGGRTLATSYENIPTAVFTDPPIGTVGLSEEEAKARFGDEVRVYRARFRPMLHSLTGRNAFTMVKLVVRGKEEHVVGCHVIGKDAPEIIQGFAVAVRLGATKADFDATVGIHPSTAEELVTLR